MVDIINRLELIACRINKMSVWVACAALVLMMAFVFCDVILRYFRHPVPGSNDIVQYLMVISVAFAIGYVQSLKRHTFIGLVTSRLSLRTQEFMAVIKGILSIGLFILLAWWSCVLARNMWLNSEGTMTLGIPIFPIIYSIALGSVLMCLALIVQLLKSLHEALAK